VTFTAQPSHHTPIHSPIKPHPHFPDHPGNADVPSAALIPHVLPDYPSRRLSTRFPMRLASSNKKTVPDLGRSLHTPDGSGVTPSDRKHPQPTSKTPSQTAKPPL
jgi:hypothetical protein